MVSRCKVVLRKLRWGGLKVAVLYTDISNGQVSFAFFFRFRYHVFGSKVHLFWLKQDFEFKDRHGYL